MICFDCGGRHERADFTCPDCGFKPPAINGFPCLAPDQAHKNQGFDPELFENLVAAKNNHFMLTYRNRLVTREIRRHFPGIERILEAGCGTGMVLSALIQAFPDQDIDASEIFVSALETARHVIGNADVTLFQMDATRMPFESEYDLIGMFDVLEHIEDDLRALENVRQALKDRGGFVLTVPQHPWLWTTADEAVHHKRRYTQSELTMKLRDAGFEVLRMTSYNSFLMPLMYVSRRLARDGASEREWRLNPVVNWVLDVVSKFENAVINLGVNLPVGGSLFVVARKV
jgi:SAM-dependent methyltransferase